MSILGLNVNELAAAGKIIPQELLDRRTRITLDACEDIYGLGQLAIVERRRILFRIFNKFPLGVTGVE